MWLSLFTIATFRDFRSSKIEQRITAKAIAVRCGQPAERVRKQIRGLVQAGAVQRDGIGLRVTLEAIEVDRKRTAPPRRSSALIGAAGFASRGAARSDAQVVVDPTIEEIAEATGQTPRAIRDQLARAYLACVARRDGRSILIGGARLAAVDRLRRPWAPAPAVGRHASADDVYLAWAEAEAERCDEGWVH